MPKFHALTLRRILALLLAYIMLCLAGGAVASTLFLPAVFGTNALAKNLSSSLEVEGINFDVTSLPQKSTMYASDGTTKIASFYAQNRTVVPLKDISQHMQQAVVANEDRRFFDHSGVDVQGVMRAFVETYIKKDDTQGGSSLTQQYVKNVLMIQAREQDDPIAEYHASEQTVARKLREMLIAVQMEKQYSKSEILQGYLNIAQFGTNNLYGVETASRRYFNVSAKDLNIVQAATIAGITKNPSKYDPSIEANLEASQARRNTVLDWMLKENYISQEEHDEAVAIPIKDTLNIQAGVTEVGCQAAGDAAFFCDYVLKQIINSDKFGKTEAERTTLVNEGGLEIYTTMDVNANSIAMDVARATIPVDDPSGFEVQIASIKPGTGEVLGFGLNRIYDATDTADTDPTHTAINYAVDEKDGGGLGFGVGSTWKPINMVAWMEAGKSINQVLSTSMAYQTRSFACARYSGSSEVWKVQTSGGGTVSRETPLQALVHSHNTTQGAMAQQIGLCSIADAAKEVGYNNAPLGQEDVYTPQYFNPSMTIGAVAASPLTMANVYATLAADGVECTPIALKRVVNASTGKEFDVPDADCHQAIDKDIAQTTAYALNQGTLPGGGATTARLDNDRKTFAKTGTQEEVAMVTGGFVPHQVATFVVVGNAENQVSFSGRTINGVTHGTWYGMYIASPAWKSFMDTYLAQANIPMENDYGTPAAKYTGAGTTARSNNDKDTSTDETSSDTTRRDSQEDTLQQVEGD